MLTTFPDGSTQEDSANAQDLIGDVSPGLNTFTLQVTAPDGITMKVYTVIVDRGGGLSGRIENLPSSHDGSTAFSVTLKFNKDISDDSIDNLDGAIGIKNGTKSDLAAVGSSKRNFTMTITPSSGDPVRILVRQTLDCSSSGHPICTAAGDALGQEIKRWVGKEDDARLSKLWLTTKDGIWLGGIGSDTYSYDGRHSFSELTMQAAPYAKGATVVVTGPAGTFTASNRWDGGATAKLNVPEGATTWRVTVTSADGNETKTYRVTVRRGEGGGGPAADVRLKTLTVTPVNGTAALVQTGFSPGHGGNDLQGQGVLRHDRGNGVCGEELTRPGRAPDAHRDGPAGCYRRGPGPGRRSVRPRDGQVRPRVEQTESLQVDLGHWPER